MTDIHRRVSRRLTGFLSNGKSADRVAAEIIQMVAASAGEAQRAETVQLGSVHEHATAAGGDAQ